MVAQFLARPLNEMIVRKNDVQAAVVIEQGLVAKASVTAFGCLDTDAGVVYRCRRLRKHKLQILGSRTQLG
jgi:hypothetical protein